MGFNKLCTKNKGNVDSQIYNYFSLVRKSSIHYGENQFILSET